MFSIAINAKDAVIKVKTESRAVAFHVKKLQLENDVNVTITEDIPASARPVKFKGID